MKLCDNCKHVDKDMRTMQFWRCNKYTFKSCLTDTEEKYYCSAARLGDLPNLCGKDGKGYEYAR